MDTIRNILFHRPVVPITQLLRELPNSLHLAAPPRLECQTLVFSRIHTAIGSCAFGLRPICVDGFVSSTVLDNRDNLLVALDQIEDYQIDMHSLHGRQFIHHQLPRGKLLNAF